MSHKEGQTYKMSFAGTDIGGILSIDENTSIDEVETTDFDSGKDKEFIPSRSSSTVNVELQYDNEDTETNTAILAMRNQTVGAIEIAPKTPEPGDESWAASGFATSIGQAFPNGDKITRTIDLRVTGPVTISTEPTV